MNTKQKAALEQIHEAIDRETGPNRLSQTEALEVLEEVQAYLEGLTEALREDIGG